jgi:hypothetical protein
MESISGLQAICTKVTINKTRDMDMEKCIGMMAVCTRESGTMEFNMVLVE